MVLNYLCSFVVFCDMCGEAFDNIHDEVQEEHKTRQKLHDDIEDLKNRISAKMVEHENRKELIPGVSRS